MTTPTLRLAHVPGAQGDNNLIGRYNEKHLLKQHEAPALLVSYVYLEAFLSIQEKYVYRDWMMDSGAYSAYNSGKEIDLEEYINACHLLKESDETLKEIIALDVIGSGEGSLKNAMRMKEAGLDYIIPVFHIGDDWEILKEYCKTFDKVGISCRFGEARKDSYKFYDGCFARVWPKKFHSFGWADEEVLMKYPLHSSDCTTWETGPCAFGRWAYFGNVSVRGSKQNLRTQVLWYLDLEKRLQDRWKKEMAILESLEAPSIHLVVGGGRTTKEVGIKAINGGTNAQDTRE